MNLSNTSEYAIRILCFMALDEKKLYTAKYLIGELKISDKYLRRIMTGLSKAELIESRQGREGGYKFVKSTENIFLLDIVNAVEDAGKYTGCVLGFANCSDENPCAVHYKWANKRDIIMEIFTTTSLSDIVANNFPIRLNNRSRN